MDLLLKFSNFPSFFFFFFVLYYNNLSLKVCVKKVQLALKKVCCPPLVSLGYWGFAYNKKKKLFVKYAYQVARHQKQCLFFPVLKRSQKLIILKCL